MERFTEYHSGVPVILDKGEGRRVAAAKRFAELEERDIAKKCLNIKGDKLKFANCPVCERRISDIEGGTFCQNCGQRLDWSE